MIQITLVFFLPVLYHSVSLCASITAIYFYQVLTLSNIFPLYHPQLQAVLGPLALETARVMAPHLEGYAKAVMTVAFLAILITAPNGALLIGILGPKILEQSEVTFPLKVELSNFHH